MFGILIVLISNFWAMVLSLFDTFIHSSANIFMSNIRFILIFLPTIVISIAVGDDLTASDDLTKLLFITLVITFLYHLTFRAPHFTRRHHHMVLTCHDAFHRDRRYYGLLPWQPPKLSCGTGHGPLQVLSTRPTNNSVEFYSWTWPASSRVVAAIRDNKTWRYQTC